jgi:regulator of cell morphogenesis and NO signaling
MNVDKQTTIGHVVARNFRTAQVFENYGLDFCCGGKKTIADACSENGINPDELIKEIEDVSENGNNEEMRFYNWEADTLTDYIISTHHTYLIRALPNIFAHAGKVAEVHGKNHPETIQVVRVFSDIKEELEVHMQKEEKMLFPYIKRIAEANRNNCETHYPPFGTIANPIRVMEMEHQNAGGLMEEINKLTDNYNPPADACTTYKVLYEELKEFENDLHVHIHLENNILFPKAIELEKKLNKQHLQQTIKE